MAKKRKPEVRIVYVKRGDYEAYRLENRQSEDDHWGMDIECPFVSSVEYPNSKGEKEYLHYELIRKLLWCIELGYDVDWGVINDKDNY